MTTLEIWLTIFGMTLVTIVTRSLFLMVGDRMTLPTRAQHALRFAPAAALIAIVLPDLLWNHGSFDLSWTNPRLMAGIASTAFYVATRRMLGMIVVGMAVYTVLRLWG
ncbi:AzlD domain-containing protein [uncultured Ralstonia sp.]|jgi:branched-subunit amino acid transport protein|uniref:AzlD domain-containing protein n=1 Tax=Ralstonia sp. TaxID=54061 RepID=UPI001EA88EF8|nr:AzlD domain-containing protein [uncultured Ralstonia sp.]UCF22568.1 MAG: AzlD domain-containing protein [Ralstonia sp.]